MTGLASRAWALNVKAAGYAEVDVWSVVYRAGGFTGAVTIVGRDATDASAKKLPPRRTSSRPRAWPSLTVMQDW